MTPVHPIRVHRANVIITSLTALTVALAACGSATTASPTADPSAAQATTQATPATTVPTTPMPTPSPAPTSAPVAAAATLPVQPAASHQLLTIHVILHAVNDTAGSLSGCSPAGSCRGDYMIGDDPLFDAATGKEVGTFAYECFLVDVDHVLYHCPGVTITLTGRGQIVFTEVIEHESGKPPAIAPITGGTDEFLGATGTVTASVVSSGGDFVIAISK
jgi:hypothetical protein